MASHGRGAARRALARFGALWHADLADPASLAVLRLRIQLAVGFGGLLVLVGLGLGDHGHWTGERVATLVATGMFVVGAMGYVWWCGPTPRDGAFVALFYVGYPVNGAVAVALDPANAVLVTAVTGLLIIVLTVLFAHRAAVAHAGTGIAVVVVTAVAVVSPPHEAKFGEYVLSVLALTVIGVTMRLIRDLAVDALVRSRHAEATDLLTGLHNRRGLERDGVAVWRAAARAGRPLAALVLDVDHFKRINDGQGHAAGDEVLRRLGALLATRTRADDLVVRLGGEEFLVLSTCVPDSVATFAERLRRTVEGELDPVTVSIGAHSVLPAQDAPWPAAVWAMVNQADHALYRAKATGRNRIVTTSGPQVVPATAVPAPRDASPREQDGPRATGAGHRRTDA